MPTQCRATVELTGLDLPARIGTYGPGDVIPDAHVLDLTLAIDPALVLIARDGMEHVFDYDPLVAEIVRLAADGPYDTQERLMTRIVRACAACPQVRAVEIALSKRPVLRPGGGTLGVRLSVPESELDRMRPA